MAEIPVRDAIGVVGIALVDEQDYARLSRHSWSLHSNGQAVRGTTGRLVSMHREVMGATHGDGRVVRHINGDVLDNRRRNLRVEAKYASPPALPRDVARLSSTVRPQSKNGNGSTRETGRSATSYSRTQGD